MVGPCCIDYRHADSCHMCWLPYRDPDGGDTPPGGRFHDWDEDANRDPEARGSDDPPEHIRRAFADQESDDGYEDRDNDYSRHTDSPVDLPANTENNNLNRMRERDRNLYDYWVDNVTPRAEIDPADPPPWWGRTLEEIRLCTEDPFAPTATATSTAEAETINYFTDAEIDVNNAQSTADA